MISKFTKQKSNPIYHLPYKLLLTLFGVLFITHLNAQTVLNGNFNSSAANWGCAPEAIHPETVYGGSNGANIVAEVDALAGLCQTISGFTIGKSYTLRFKCSRRAVNPVVQAMSVTIDGGALATNVSRNGTPFNFVVESFTFIASSTTHTLTFAGIGSSGTGLILDNITIRSTQFPGGISANLQLWVKANVGTSTTTNGANVNTWEDQSIQGNDGVAAGFPPAYSNTTAELINYNPVLNFTTAGSDFLNTNSTLNISDNSLNPFTLFGVSRYVSGVHMIYLGGQGNGPPNAAFSFGVQNSLSLSRIAVLRFNEPLPHPVLGPAGSYPVATDKVAISKAVRSGTIGSDFVNDRFGNATTCAAVHPVVNLRIGAGGGGNTGNSFNANHNMGELIVYDAALSDADQRKVDSYLAIKYAQTLSNVDGGIHGDYEATDGTLIWDASLAPAYQNDMIGLGRDDTEGLNHQQSHTLDDTARIYLSTLAQRNELNAGSFSNDISYVIMGSNDDAMCDNLASNAEVPIACNLATRVAREWKITKTNMTETLSIDLTLGACDLANLSNTAILRLLIDDDGDFSNGGTTCHFNGDGTGVVITTTGGTITIANLDNSHLPNNSTQFITLGALELPAPGGISQNLQLWLKANTGTSTTTNGANVNTWEDQSIQGNDGVAAGFPPAYSNIAAELINYNPVVNFTTAGTNFLNTNNTLNISDNSLNPFTLFGVSRYLSGGHMIYLGGQGNGPPNAAFSFGVQNSLSVSRVAVLRFNAFGCHPVLGPIGSYPIATDKIAISKAVRSGTTGSDFVNDRFGNTTTCASLHPTVNLRVGAGGGGNTGNSFNADHNMGELIVYDAALSDADQRKVDSYLAIKYGQTLSNVDGGIHGDYEATDGTLIWDASLAPTYQNDMIGLGRDDRELLNHQQSHTLDDTVRVYLSTLAQRNELNAGSFSNDISYLVMGSNDGAMCDNLAANAEVPAACNLSSRLTREWEVTKTNMTENFSIDLKLGPCQITNSITAANLRLLVDDDGNFSNGGTSCYFNGDGTGLVISYAAGNVTLANIANIHLPNNSTRFITLASTDILLPVDLLAFDAACEDRNIVLNWTTTAEINNDHFIVERAADAINFEPLTSVNAQAGQINHYYQYTDEQPLEGINYYRLQQVDLDGTQTPSNIISATCTTSETDAILIFPNPFNHQLIISNLSKLSFPLQIEVYNNLGQAVYQKRLEKTCPNTTLDLGNRLVAGVYILKITNSEIGLSKKVIKQ